MTSIDAPDWERLANAIARARKAAGMTQDDFAAALGISRTAVQKLERPTATWSKVQPIHRVAASALGWTEKSVELILAGGDPTVGDDGQVVVEFRNSRLADPDVETIVQVLSNARMSVLQQAFRELGWGPLRVGLVPDSPTEP